jgi:hypothetical protein
MLMTLPLFVISLPDVRGGVCDPVVPATFTVHLPKVGLPPDDEGQGWDRRPVWEHHPNATDDSITIPNGRPIYALIVSGYASNKDLDELMVYNFARHLMARGAYVHYAWWNNLLAPYMERPLHHTQSHPGSLTADGLGTFVTAEDASHKGTPGEDYQFVADAKRLLIAIRQHNPSAMIIVVGHSMGGGAVVHLGTQTDVVLDILAPIDPVGNRNYPWAGILGLGPPVRSDYNFTRWRVSRDNFLGYKSADWQGIDTGCVPFGPWLKDASETDNDLLCANVLFADPAPTLRFGRNVINLHHRYQMEYLFPFDYFDEYDFGHSRPPGGSTSQAEVPMTPQSCGFLKRCPDPGGWPNKLNLSSPCCETGDGVGWDQDGHGEIVGYRGPFTTVPLGVRVRTSPRCGDCPNRTWPARTESDGVWSNGNSALRVALLRELETLPAGANWAHRPTNPNLCLVSPGLIQRFNTMNRPPVANAGADQLVECMGPNGTEVQLDGSQSSDPDNDLIEYSWTWATGNAQGVAPKVMLPKGTHCITLTVSDPSGHIDQDVVAITVQDTTPPTLTVSLSPQVLWPPNHKMVKIRATVHAQDLCGTVTDLKLVSIVSNQPDNGLGDGNTTGDIAANVGTLDLLFYLRAERAGLHGDRIYKVTYRATDDSGNRAHVSKDVIVPHDARSHQNRLKILRRR